MAEARIEGVSKKLGSLVAQKMRLLGGARDELEKMSQSLSTMRGLLLELESRGTHDERCRVWLTELRDIMSDADDLFDELSFLSLRRSVMSGGKFKEVRLFFSASNQLVYGLKLAPRIKDLSAKLQRLQQDGANLSSFNHHHHQLPALKNPTTRVSVRPPHVSVVGRVSDKEAVIEALLHRNCQENVGIVGIFGCGGIGKTTLARMVFDDLIMKTEFQSRMWVFVDRDFHVKRVLQDMMIQLSRQLPGMDDSSPSAALSLSNKKVLLVLDDMQHDDPEKWSKLSYLLDQAARGSRILLTVRAPTQVPVPMLGVHHLGGLSETESWSLFEQVASQRGKNEEHCLRERIGREIIDKCAGLPLVIKVVASVLHSKSTQDWLHFGTKELPRLGGGESGNNVMSALNWSYKHLPPHLKSCFLYCSLFPRGQKIHVPRLINLWIAEGFLKPSDPSQCPEAIGVQHFRELLGWSFFEEVEEDELGNIVSCRMHELIRDLATMVAGTEFVFSSKGLHLIKPKSRHAAFSGDPTTPWELPDHLFEATNLRTLLLSNETRSHAGVLKPACQLEEKHLHLIASKLGLLRAFDLHNSDITRLPTSIANLKFLTYLDLSENKTIQVLPDSITRLMLLQILNLDNCERLLKLPRDIKDLASLIHLGVENCGALTHMPRGIGRLTSLSTLSRFVLPIDSSISKYSANLGELQNLNGLRGTLGIYNLSHAEGAQYEFEAANLKAKKDLRVLRLEWSDGGEDPNDYDPIDLGDDTVAMEALQPHFGLERLELRGYRGTKFPSWLSSLTKLVAVTFESCEKCQYLPPLHQLSGLKSLVIEGMTALKYVQDVEINGVGLINFFPSLEKLVLSRCPELLGWQVAAPTTLPQLELCRLSKLSITACPNLSSTSMPVFPSLKSVKISGSRLAILEQILAPPQVSSSASSLSSSSSLLALSQLESLDIEYIKDLESLPGDLFQNLMPLKTLRIAKCRSLKTLLEGIRHLTSLTILSIEDCKELDLCDDTAGNDKTQWQGLKSLHCLSIYHIPKLKSLPHWIQHLTSLWSLEIIGCCNLESLPDWMSRRHSLQLQVITSCPKLKTRCKSGRGEDWPKIVHIKKAVQGSCFEEKS